MGSKRILISGIGWCYEVTADLENKLENNVIGDKKVIILNQKTNGK